MPPTVQLRNGGRPMTAPRTPKRPGGLGKLLDYVAAHAPVCCPSGDDDPDPAAHDPSCWFPGQVEWYERMEAARSDRLAERARQEYMQEYMQTQLSKCEAKSVETRRTSPVTSFQERTLWHVYRHGLVTAFTCAPEDGGKRVGWPSVHNLELKGLLTVYRGETLTVSGVTGQEYSSPTMFTAQLSRAGQEWIAERMAGDTPA